MVDMDKTTLGPCAFCNEEIVSIDERQSVTYLVGAQQCTLVGFFHPKPCAGEILRLVNDRTRYAKRCPVCDARPGEFCTEVRELDRPELRHQADLHEGR
jgi:hypothetical protein